MGIGNLIARGALSRGIKVDDIEDEWEKRKFLQVVYKIVPPL